MLSAGSTYDGRMTNARERELERLEDIPNVGKAIAADLRLLGFERPAELSGQDPYELYDRINVATGQRQDPCLLDTFIAAVRYVDGGPRLPWWAFTAERKRTLAQRAQTPPLG
jgi:DNA transformation protein